MSTKSALSEAEGTRPESGINPGAAKRIRDSRRKELVVEELVNGILKGSKTALGQAITLVESNQPKHQEKAARIIEKSLPFANKSLRIGITGVPGVGKSTFIEAFGSYLANSGKKVGVLAVDPTSSVSGGSILGDKTRMETLVNHKNAFIRPSPSGDALGGVAKKTRETIILCEAAGFDTLLIETVGVGQSETTVHSMTDFFLLLKLAGAGDELQGIKRGIMEMADAIVINKADGDNIKPAEKARSEFRRALHLYPAKASGWTPKVLLCSAYENTGIEEVWNLISEFQEQTKASGHFSSKRQEQNKFWLLQTINEHLKRRFYQHPKIKELLPLQLTALEKNETTAFEAAALLLKAYEK
ncbi:methylmalonyl Co-A mutase-associated GTPase MeaB [Salinimicrobium oceani]|uniref:Methylmalonyl Co-A mutase-associated GTPase MeaB n=1 Tax=Salinimicrobium oceani TaxID=2722702 RepID=A0ABX1CZK3_9FLAO|nr:methylmalonyl Co-A mutase-associated GTPase MeaB [Salinimicrobium oceani]NJW53690.1 methylmalonyl Co-A mutase-associated GTPase MeaB [Salinimicrobium oceani]